MTMITPSYLGETIEYSSLHACRSTLEDPTSCPADLKQNELAEMFDKYNLHALPVVDAVGRMVGVVHADHVISFLREKL